MNLLPAKGMALERTTTFMRHSVRRHLDGPRVGEVIYPFFDQEKWELVNGSAYYRDAITSDVPQYVRYLNQLVQCSKGTGILRALPEGIVLQQNDSPEDNIHLSYPEKVFFWPYDMHKEEACQRYLNAHLDPAEVHIWNEGSISDNLIELFRFLGISERDVTIVGDEENFEAQVSLAEPIECEIVEEGPRTKQGHRLDVPEDAT